MSMFCIKFQPMCHYTPLFAFGIIAALYGIEVIHVSSWSHIFLHVYFPMVAISSMHSIFCSLFLPIMVSFDDVKDKILTVISVII